MKLSIFDEWILFIMPVSHTIVLAGLMFLLGQIIVSGRCDNGFVLFLLNATRYKCYKMDE